MEESKTGGAGCGVGSTSSTTTSSRIEDMEVEPSGARASAVHEEMELGDSEEEDEEDDSDEDEETEESENGSEEEEETDDEDSEEDDDEEELTSSRETTVMSPAQHTTSSSSPQYEGLASTLHAMAAASSGKPLTLNLKRGRGRPSSKQASPVSQSPAHRTPGQGPGLTNGSGQGSTKQGPPLPMPLPLPQQSALMQKKPLGLRLKKSRSVNGVNQCFYFSYFFRN
uniref:Uncharacterized protein n=1 Tax=Cacopsylla melanoneura TaxID=428564 RepID=A0A8D8YU88_9HEMI